MIENVEAEDINEDNLYDVITDEINTRLIYYNDQWEVLKHYYYPNEIDVFIDAIDKLADDIEKCVKMYWDEKDEDEDSEELEEESRKLTESFSERKMPLAKMKDLVRKGNAIDVTDYSYEDFDELRDRENLEKYAYSMGMNGCNGQILQGKSGKLYAILGRTSLIDYI